MNYTFHQELEVSWITIKEDEFIRDGGKIRNCPANIAKMNIFQHIVFLVFQQNMLWYSLEEIGKSFIEGIKEVLTAIVQSIFLILFPITLIFVSYFSIREAKKKVEKRNRVYQPKADSTK